MAKEKRKLSKKSKEESEEEEEEEVNASEDEEEEERPAKRAKKAPEAKPKKKKDEDTDVDGQDLSVHEGPEGEKYISLGKNRRVTIRKYAGKPLVDIREFYVDKKDEQTKPGKKGISLTPEQWDSLKKSISSVDDVLATL